MTPLRTDPPVALRTRDIAELVAASGYPCISVLMATQPAARMIARDRDRLFALIETVGERLADDGERDATHLLGRLAAEVADAAQQPTDRGLCLYVNATVARSFRLLHAVPDQALVESTFATRPLVVALHRMPPHLVLAVHATCAHLYAAHGGGLHPLDRLETHQSVSTVRVPGSGEPGASAARAELTVGFLLGVDEMLGTHRVDHPSPLVLAGPPHLLDQLCARSRHLDRLAGRLDDRDHASILDLALESIAAVERYLRSRRVDALAQLQRTRRERSDDVAAGIEACWRSVGSRRPSMLLVEETYISPGRAFGEPLPLTSSPADRAVEVHDLVDDLMEQVILRGGQLALVADDDLAELGRVALVSHPRVGA